MRERIEDLGRIMVMIERALDSEIFSEDNRPYRPKDTDEWLDRFEKWSEEAKFDWFQSLFYKIEDLSDQLHEVLAVSKGWDALNEIQDGNYFTR